MATFLMPTMKNGCNLALRKRARSPGQFVAGVEIGIGCRVTARFIIANGCGAGPRGSRPPEQNAHCRSIDRALANCAVGTVIRTVLWSVERLELSAAHVTAAPSVRLRRPAGRNPAQSVSHRRRPSDSVLVVQVMASVRLRWCFWRHDCRNRCSSLSRVDQFFIESPVLLLLFSDIYIVLFLFFINLVRMYEWTE